MSDELARLACLALLIASVGGYLVVEFRRDAGATSRGIVAWGLIFVGVIGAAGLWQDARRDILPRQRVTEAGRIEVPLGQDGHFHLTAEVNGVPVRFVVDTGASALALRRRDAERAGIDIGGLAYAGRAQTANGIVPTATVRLDEVRIGEIVDNGVAAVVIHGDVEQSLMGMDYLRRFARVGFEGETLVLER